MVGSLDGVMEYGDIRSTAGKLLQYVRSMPGVTATIVGQKVSGCACPHSASLACSAGADGCTRVAC
jgi:hypothetical protein